MRRVIEYPAVITKADITPVGQLIGKANAGVVRFDGGEPIKPGTLRFLGFAGALNTQDGLYHGMYRFEPLPSAVEASDRFDFEQLPQEAAQ